MDYDKLMEKEPAPHVLPTRPVVRLTDIAPKLLFRKDLKANPYTLEKVNMERAGEGPWLILMNHSSVYDVKIVYDILKSRPIAPVVTVESTAGRDLLAKIAGSLTAKKYVAQQTLIFDIRHSLKTHKAHVLLYPEASCSLDGTGLQLPDNLGVLFKYLKVPVVMMHARGTFLHTPVFNFPYSRKAPVHIKMECLLTPEEIREKSKQELSDIVNKAFVYDHFRWQYENKIRIDEPTRAEGLQRVLYKCPHCLTERRMESSGTKLKCNACGKEYEMTEYGRMQALSGETEFPHIPDWYAWEREQVSEEIRNGSYCYDVDGEIAVMRTRKALYRVGAGHLHSDRNGITITGSDGKVNYHHGPTDSYSVCCDYKLYYLGDNIAFGNEDNQYYFFTDRFSGLPKVKMAVEEIFRLETAKKSE